MVARVNKTLLNDVFDVGTTGPEPTRDGYNYSCLFKATSTYYILSYVVALGTEIR